MNGRGVFPAYLQGMETAVVLLDHSRSVEFPAYLQGMETGLRPVEPGGEARRSQPTYKEWKRWIPPGNTWPGSGSQPTYKEWKRPGNRRTGACTPISGPFPFLVGRLGTRTGPGVARGDPPFPFLVGRLGTPRLAAWLHGTEPRFHSL